MHFFDGWNIGQKREKGLTGKCVSDFEGETENSAMWPPPPTFKKFFMLN